MLLVLLSFRAWLQRSKRRLFLGPHGGSLFRSSDKQTLINRIIRSPVVEGGAGLGVHSPLSDSIEMAIPLHMYARLMELRNDWLTFWKKPIVGAARPAPAAPYIANPAAKPGHGGPDVNDVATVASRSSGTTYSAASVWSGAGQIEASGVSAATSQVNPEAVASADVAVGVTGVEEAKAGVVAAGAADGQRESNGSGSTGGVSEHKGGEGGRGSESSGKTGDSSNASTRDSVDTHASVVSNVTWASRGTTASNLKWKRRPCGRRVKDFFASVLYQPLDRVASYFGESVAFYFAWLGAYEP